MEQTANIRHLVFLSELPQDYDPFFAALAGFAMVVRPWYIAACKIAVEAKSAGSGDLVFTLMDALLYRP
jgi:hypothetical protein